MLVEKENTQERGLGQWAQMNLSVKRGNDVGSMKISSMRASQCCMLTPSCTLSSQSHHVHPERLDRGDRAVHITNFIYWHLRHYIHVHFHVHVHVHVHVNAHAHVHVHVHVYVHVYIALHCISPTSSMVSSSSCSLLHCIAYH